MKERRKVIVVALINKDDKASVSYFPCFRGKIRYIQFAKVHDQKIIETVLYRCSYLTSYKAKACYTTG